MDAFDVVVIGGGIAGLTAARDLERAGYLVGLLEARSRFGGRIASTRGKAGGPAIELGAEFVHGSPPETLQLLEEAGLTRSNAGPLEIRRAPRGWQGDPHFFDQVESVLDGVGADDGVDRSFREWLEHERLEPRLRERALSYVEGFFASFSERIGTAGLAREQRATRQHGDQSSRLSRGYGALVDHLVPTFGRTILKVETWANAVHWSPAGVRIDADTVLGGYECAARRAIVTLPVGVLRSTRGGAVRFDPALTSKTEALHFIEPGLARRITFEFRDPFWNRLAREVRDLDELGFLHLDGLRVPIFWTSFPEEAPRLVGWLGGHAAAGIPHDGVESAGRQALAQAFGMSEAALRREIIAAHSHDWVGDPATAGAYSYVKVGGIDAPRRLAEPVADVIFFAGEATHHEGELGTVAAAIATGHRAAAEVMSLHA